MRVQLGVRGRSLRAHTSMHAFSCERRCGNMLQHLEVKLSLRGWCWVIRQLVLNSAVAAATDPPESPTYERYALERPTGQEWHYLFTGVPAAS